MLLLLCITVEVDGELFACIAGKRCRVHIVAGLDLDFLIPYDEGYADYYEDLDESLVDRAVAECPDLVERAYEDVADPAAKELERAVAYIAVMLGQPSAATSLADEFQAKLDVLADNPFLYAPTWTCARRRAPTYAAVP